MTAEARVEVEVAVVAQEAEKAAGKVAAEMVGGWVAARVEALVALVASVAAKAAAAMELA